MWPAWAAPSKSYRTSLAWNACMSWDLFCMTYKTTSTTDVSKEAMLQLKLQGGYMIDWKKQQHLNLKFMMYHHPWNNQLWLCMNTQKRYEIQKKQADHEYLEEGNPKWWFIYSMQQKKWDSWCYSCSFAAESNLSLQKRFMIVVTYMEGKL